MINFSAISNNSLIGKFLRGILKLVPKNLILPILQGRLKGKKWVIGSGAFGYWLGTYELEKQKFFEKVVKKDDVVYDIGANVGFYTLLASELIGPNGRVFAFEPLPRNIFYLKKHIKLNKLNNIAIIEAAVSDKKGVLNFSEYESNATGRLGKEGQLKVSSVVLDDLLKDGKILPPNVLKIDVEGAEAEVLKGAGDILSKHRPDIFLSIHDKRDFNDYFDFFKKLGYNLRSVTDRNMRETGEVFVSFNK